MDLATEINTPDYNVPPQPSTIESMPQGKKNSQFRNTFGPQQFQNTEMEKGKSHVHWHFDFMPVLFV